MITEILCFSMRQSVSFLRMSVIITTNSRFFIKKSSRFSCSLSNRRQMMATSLPPKAIVTFGVLADVQYANCDNRLPADLNSKTRFYRGALNQVEEAFKYWKSSPKDVQFVLQLGDIIDGLSKIHGGSHSSLQKTMSCFKKHPSIPTFHTVGNHELYNFKRKELASLFYEAMLQMNIPADIFVPVEPSPDDKSVTLYYKFHPVPEVKFISLDCFDVSVLGYDRSHEKFQEASRVLESKHGHDVFDDWDCDGSLQDMDIRFQQMNGAVGKDQLAWLEHELKESDASGQKVIVFGHVSLHPDSSNWSCLLWNYNEVVDIFQQHSCVIAYLCGHTHESGYALDSHGISYVAFAGIVETPPDTTAFATISIHHDRLEIEGHGLECTYSIPLKRDTGKRKKISKENIDHEFSNTRLKV